MALTLPRAPRAPSTLQLALGLSLLAHAALLTVRFVDPQRFDRLFQDTPLEVILVNARTQAPPPDKAQAIAQAALAGGGDAERGRATTPLPYASLNASGDATDDAARQIEGMQAQQAQMLAQVKKLLADLPAAPVATVQPDPQAAEREDRRRQLLKLLAEIERRINEENARPKRRYISPATREAVYAAYYDALRHKVEDKGTENFPEVAGQKLYGELTMVITVNFDGRILATEIVASSGSRLLDKRAEAIARSAAPFGTFNPEMRRQADQIVVVSRFKFTREETLQTNLTGQ